MTDNYEWLNETSNVIKKFRNNKVTFIKFPKNITKNIDHNPNIAMIDLHELKITHHKLIKKKFLPEKTCDLHGFNKEQAFKRLINFIDRSIIENIRQLLIITGKGNKITGSGVIKSSMSNWINHVSIRSKISSFSHASSNYGGSGAFFILLKKN